MLIELAQHVVADARAREAEGDCPSPRRYSAEQVEAALVTVADALRAAEAKRDALREALAEVIKADTHLAWTGGAVPEPSHEEFGACAEIARQALTQETANVGE